MATTDETTKAEKVLQLTIELLDMKQKKKDSNKGFNDEIKRLNEEIEELLEEDVEPAAEAEE